MNIAFDGIQEAVVTFEAESTVEPNQVVKISGNGTVSACSAGDPFCGLALSLRDGAAAVQIGGFMTVTCASGCPALGPVTLVADGSGGVKTAGTSDTTGISAQVVSTDTTNLTAVIYL